MAYIGLGIPSAALTSSGTANSFSSSPSMAGSLTAATFLTATAGNITASAGNIVATLGSVSAGTTVSATTTMTAGTGITATTGNITASSGNLSASGTVSGVGLTSTGPIVFEYVSSAVTPYVVATTDYYISIDSSGGAKQVNLPNAPTTNRMFVIKDLTGSAGSNHITVTTVGGAVNIDGAFTYLMNIAYQSVQLVFNGTTYEVF